MTDEEALKLKRGDRVLYKVSTNPDVFVPATIIYSRPARAAGKDGRIYAHIKLKYKMKSTSRNRTDHLETWAFAEWIKMPD